MRRNRRTEAEVLFNAKRYGDLATYNAERARGLVHTPEYAAEMAKIQARFDAEHGYPSEPPGKL